MGAKGDKGDKGVYPTHVGMNRAIGGKQNDTLRLPHACGDEPLDPCGDEPMGAKGDKGDKGVYPTHVGMNRNCLPCPLQ